MSWNRLLPAVFTAAVVGFARPSGAAPSNAVSLAIEPPALTLAGPRAAAHYVVLAREADGTLEDVTAQAAVTVSDRKVAAAQPAVVRPVGDGAAVLAARWGGQTARVPVRVRDSHANRPIEFAREVVPVLTHAGCNQGACHGSQYGKGGFKLSLSGFDPSVDYYAIVRQAGGRRVHRYDPAHSLLLLKPTLGVRHQGGLRLRPGSADYMLLARWLAEGAPGPTPKDPEVTKVEVYPRERVFQPGGAQPLVVRATWSDGVVQDVTPWARLNTLNDAVAAVSPDGVVRAVGRGETSIMVRFGGQATVARMSVPFARIARYPAQPENNLVDGLVARKWRTLGLLPSPLCDDATFIRRVYFDVIGTPPAPDEVKAFLADRVPDKRAKLIDTVLARPEYADYWTLKWGDLLRSNRQTLSPKGMWSFTNWIRAQLRDNRPMDQFCRDLITAQGSTFTDGPANYYRVASSPPDLAETTAQVFLGTRLQCTKCHHHPFERWSQDDYYRFAAFFARVGQKGSQEFGIFGNEQVVRLQKGGEVYNPKTGALEKPAPLGGYPAFMQVRDTKDTKSAKLVDPDPDAGGDRRALLAEWITRDNPLFARNIANRYWGYLMGRGLVEPVDDQRVTNPPSNPELLDALAKDFASHGYDVKRLIRIICSSRAYQLSSQATRDNRADTTFYTHFLVRRLPAEPLFDAINFATGTREKFPDLPLGTRAIQLPDPTVSSYFLDTFGRAPRIIACECERGAEPNMTQALHLIMGDMVNRKVQDPNGTLGKLLASKEKKSDAEIIEALYLSALNRPPTADERYKAEQAVREVVDRPALVPPKPLFFLRPRAVPRTRAARDRDRKQALEDILWALLNSREFVFNH